MSKDSDDEILCPECGNIMDYYASVNVFACSNEKCPVYFDLGKSDLDAEREYISVKREFDEKTEEILNLSEKIGILVQKRKELYKWMLCSPIHFRRLMMQMPKLEWQSIIPKRAKIGYLMPTQKEVKMVLSKCRDYKKRK